MFHIPGCIFLNDGHGNLSLAGRPPEGGNTLADLNHTGKADLAAFSGDSLMIWPGSGDPNYAVSPTIIHGSYKFRRDSLVFESLISTATDFQN